MTKTAPIATAVINWENPIGFIFAKFSDAQTIAYDSAINIIGMTKAMTAAVTGLTLPKPDIILPKP